jgi:predicted PurR-regulated permease PerM
MKYFSYIFFTLIFFTFQAHSEKIPNNTYTITENINNLTLEQKKELINFLEEKYKTIENDSDKQEIKNLLDFINSNQSNLHKIKNFIKHVSKHIITKAALTFLSIIAIIYEIKKIKNKKTKTIDTKSDAVSQSYKDIFLKIFEEESAYCDCLSDAKYLKETKRISPKAPCYTYYVDGTPVIIHNAKA